MLLQGVDIQHVAWHHVIPCYPAEKSDNFLWCNMDFSSCNIFVYFPFLCYISESRWYIMKI